MTHLEDLTDCDYFGQEHAHVLRAVGWLSADENFAVGTTDSQIFEQLKALLSDPWQPMAFCGVHHCELCQYDPACGHANLFVPDGSVIYVCPELIVHYIAAHHYRPPDEFLQAVATCPNTHTIKYKKLLLESGGRSLVRKTE